MSQDVSADVVVLGAGPAGYVSAIRLAQLGKKVTIIDKDEIGGVCLNRGCIPSKVLIHAASFYEKISRAAEMGIDVDGARLDLPRLMKWKNSVVKKLTSGVATLLKANGCKVVAGTARFSGPSELAITTSDGQFRMSFNQCVIATGSRPVSLPGFEVDQKRILDSSGALDVTEVPRSMLCVGGGYIGLELGTFFAKLGTDVTVVEAFPNLLGGVDPELTAVVRKKLEKRGVKVMTHTQVKSVRRTENEMTVLVSQALPDEGVVETSIPVEVVLVTVGRIPNSDHLDLEKTGLVPDSRGFVAVNSRMQTKVPQIYAIGDVAGPPLLAHKGSKQGIIAAEAIAGLKSSYDVIAMPAVIFTDPEIATVGLSEAEAREKGFETKVGTFPFIANGRALSIGEGEGFVRLIGDAKTGRLLGAHIVGPDASNLISEPALAIEMGAQVEDVALTVHPHPSLPEALMEAAEATLGHAIHIYQRDPRGDARAHRERARA
ncbi:MAG: dihydrolipoyl dehydrogenase [Bdellovibrionales bacterium RIFOXYC1_FULL_54_43]|nr:MAG: dihydrolipoyl dehydrogenase [Bdellovibrionales bacterium RIFOXYC1_FULL_54_43]OFZ78346.1 MAG: dihydrolipoyl dehydrogenase [Bdellovibrionales bacterium RIFOXYD1_FULL_55_31]